MLLPFARFHNSSGKEVVKDVILDEGDPLWCEHRHRHISEVTPEINRSIQVFAQSSKSFSSLSKGKEKDIKKMQEMGVCCCIFRPTQDSAGGLCWNRMFAGSVSALRCPDCARDSRPSKSSLFGPT